MAAEFVQSCCGLLTVVGGPGPLLGEGTPTPFFFLGQLGNPLAPQVGTYQTLGEQPVADLADLPDGSYVVTLQSDGAGGLINTITPADEFGSGTGGGTFYEFDGNDTNTYNAVPAGKTVVGILTGNGYTSEFTQVGTTVTLTGEGALFRGKTILLLQ